MLCCQSIIKLEFSFVDWHTHSHTQTERQTHIHMQTLWLFSGIFGWQNTTRQLRQGNASQYFNVRQILLFTFVFRAETAPAIPSPCFGYPLSLLLPLLPLISSISFFSLSSSCQQPRITRTDSSLLLQLLLLLLFLLFLPSPLAIALLFLGCSSCGLLGLPAASSQTWLRWSPSNSNNFVSLRCVSFRYVSFGFGFGFANNNNNNKKCRLTQFEPRPTTTCKQQQQQQQQRQQGDNKGASTSLWLCSPSAVTPLPSPCSPPPATRLDSAWLSLRSTCIA